MTQSPRRLIDSLRGLLDTVLGVLETRVELLVTELEEEKVRLLSIAALGGVAFVLLSLGLVFLVITITVLFWDDHRLLVLGTLTAILLGGGGTALVVTLRNVKPRARLLGATLSELKKDRAALREREP